MVEHLDKEIFKAGFDSDEIVHVQGLVVGASESNGAYNNLYRGVEVPDHGALLFGITGADPHLYFGTYDPVAEVVLQPGADLGKALRVTTANVQSATPVVLPGDPVNPLEASTKQYADTAPLGHFRGYVASTTLPNAATTGLSTATSVVKDAGFTVSGSTLTVAANGYYLISMAGKFSLFVASGKRFFMDIATSGVSTSIRNSVGVAEQWGSVTAMRYLAAGETISYRAYQDSGSASSVVECYLYARRVG